MCVLTKINALFANQPVCRDMVTRKSCGCQNKEGSGNFPLSENLYDWRQSPGASGLAIDGYGGSWN
jgi:hypothetical protein